MKKTLVLLSALTILLAGAANARAAGYFSDTRGHHNCLARADSEFKNLNADRTYFVNELGPTKTIYINDLVRKNGDWEALRIACETSKSGRRLLSLSAEPGEFTPRFVIGEIPVAGAK